MFNVSPVDLKAGTTRFSLYFRKDHLSLSHHSVNADKVFGFLGPGRKLHVTHRNSVITHPELVLITVHEHLRQVVELWDQLLMDTTETQQIYLQNYFFALKYH